MSEKKFFLLKKKKKEERKKEGRKGRKIRKKEFVNKVIYKNEREKLVL